MRGDVVAVVGKHIEGDGQRVVGAAGGVGARGVVAGMDARFIIREASAVGGFVEEVDGVASGGDGIEGDSDGLVVADGVGDGEELGDIVVGRKFVDEVGERGESPCTTTEEYTGEGVAVLVDEDDEANVVDAKRDYRVEEPCAMGGRSNGEAGGAEEAEEVPIACPGPGERG